MSTFGQTSPGATAVMISATYLRAWLFTGGPTSGILQSLSIYGAGISGGQNVQLGIYSYTTGNLIGHTASIATTPTPGWWTGAASGTLNDPAGSYYICQENATGGNWTAYATTSSGVTNDYAAETYGTWPSTIPSLTAQYSTYIFSAYATYTSGGGPVTSGNMFAVL